jgi:hypothetical protein
MHMSNIPRQRFVPYERFLSRATGETTLTDEPSVTGPAMSQRARRCVLVYTLAHSDLIALVEIITSDDCKAAQPVIVSIGVHVPGATIDAGQDRIAVVYPARASYTN